MTMIRVRIARLGNFYTVFGSFGVCVYVSGRWVGKKIDYCNGGGVVVMIYI